MFNIHAGSPWKVHIIDKHKLSVEGDDRLDIHETTSVYVNTGNQSLVQGDLEVSITGEISSNQGYNLR